MSTSIFKFPQNNFARPELHQSDRAAVAIRRKSGTIAEKIMVRRLADLQRGRLAARPARLGQRGFGNMPWKMDGDKIAIENGNPVWVYDDGKEATIDGSHVTQKIADLTSEAATNRRKLREAQTALEGFEGLDAAAARKAIATVKNLDDKKLIDAGEVEKVKSEIEKAWTEKYAALETRFKATEGDLYNEKVGGSFARSEFVQKKLTVPMDMVQDKFGKCFKVEDGNVVAYDETGNKIYSREKPGELAGFDEALTTLIDRYPHKASILADSGHSGGGAHGGGGGGGTGRQMGIDEFNRLPPAEQYKFKSGGGEII